MAKAAGTGLSRGVKQQVNRNALISVFLFAILIGTVSFDYASTSSGIQEQQRMQQGLAQLEGFRASLPDVLVPLDDFVLTGNAADKQRLGTAFIAFQRAYSGISALPDIGAEQNRQLKQAFDLIQRAEGIASDILVGKTPSAQTKDMVLVARDLVSVARSKVKQVASGLGTALQRQGQGMQTRMMTLAAVNLALIVLLLLVFIVLSRGLVKTMARALADISADAHSASNTVLAAAGQQIETVEAQAFSLTTITRDIEQMSGTAKKVAATATGVERIIDASSRFAEQGGKDIDELVALLHAIQDSVHMVSERVTASQSKAERIVESLASVQEIAEETHLLALNASIESASVGEHGKRFAVVAAEVRRLSERVREFTEEIEGVIGEVNASVQASVEATQNGLAKIEQGMAIAGRAGEALGQMRNMSDKTGQAVRVIAQATGRQDKTSQVFLEDVRQVASLLHDSAQQLQDLQDSAHRVTGLAEDLQKPS